MSDNAEFEMKVFQESFNGNQNAIQLCLNFLYIAHFWDDLIDKDKDRTDDEINKAFEIMLIFIPANPIYKEYGDILRPMLHSTMLAWYESNIKEKGGEKDKFYAFFLRNALLNIIIFICFLIGGDLKKLHNYFCDQFKDQYDNFVKE